MTIHRLMSCALALLVWAPAVDAATVHESVFTRLDASGGNARVWVIFADKGPIDTTAALRQLETTYHRKALDRRRLRRTAPGLFDERDLAVHAAYLKAVAATGADVVTVSRWVNGASVRATRDQIDRIAALPFVKEVLPMQQLERKPGAETPPSSFPFQWMPVGAQGFYGFADAQLNLINVPALHAQGFTGQGVIIGALDTGFRTDHAAFNEPGHLLQIVAEWDFLNDDAESGPEPGDAATQHNHGTQVLGTMGAYKPGELVGSAYDASYILAKVESVEFENTSEEALFVAGLEFIEANGGDVATSSVVIFDTYLPSQFDGLTAPMSIGVNTATANGLHVCQGIGNNGHDANPATTTMVPPADAFQAITVGSVDAVGATARFTSDGPTADGRNKPEVIARGVDVRTVSPSATLGYQEVNGASFATPTTAGVVACLVQAHPEWTVDQMRWALTRTADYYLQFGGFDPLYIRGYGIIDAAGASAASPPAPGDLDQNGTVDTLDFLQLLAAWGPCPAPCPPLCPADVNTDCQVDTLDLLLLLANWG